MNNRRRLKLNAVMSLLETASDAASVVMDEERDALDRIPENLQSSLRYEQMEAVIDLLEEAVASIDSARDQLGDACE